MCVCVRVGTQSIRICTYIARTYICICTHTVSRMPARGDGFRIYKLCMRNIAWDCHARPPSPSPDYANLLSCSCCCITRRSCVREYISRYEFVRAIHIYYTYTKRICNVGRRRKFDVDVHARRRPPPPPPATTRERLRACSECASTRLSVNDLSHPRNSGGPECTKCIGRKRAILLRGNTYL